MMSYRLCLGPHVRQRKDLHVEYKSAVYTINSSSSEQFTFWWGDGASGIEYFDVSIAVDPLRRRPAQLPLVE
jgi:hypothetical protein